MKKTFAILFALSFLLLLWANGTSHSGQIAQRPPGNIPDGMYMIVGEASHRCLEIPNASCRADVGLQTLDCDPTDKSNNQKFNILADGSGYYTVSPVHSDLCLEVSGAHDDQGQRCSAAECQHQSGDEDRPEPLWPPSAPGHGLRQLRWREHACSRNA